MDIADGSTSRNSFEPVGQMREAGEQVGYCSACHATIDRAARECPACGRVEPLHVAEMEDLVRACCLQG